MSTTHDGWETDVIGAINELERDEIDDLVDWQMSTRQGCDHRGRPTPTDHRGARPLGTGEETMSVKPNVDFVAAAAREFIRSESDGCVVSIGQLLDELSDKFGDRFRVSPDMYKLIDLIETLWADPHIDQVPHTGWVEFRLGALGDVDPEERGGPVTVRPPDNVQPAARSARD